MNSRSRKYRMAVAELCCVKCGIDGYSQAAHPNSHKWGKGLGLKADDYACVPLCCDRPGIVGCHTQWDQHKIAPKEEREAIWRRWMSWTKAALAAGMAAHEAVA